MIFKEVESGLYLYKLKKDDNSIEEKVSGYSFLTLVSANKSLYTSRQLARADEAKKLYQHLGMPGYKKFFRALTENHIKDCPITIDDAKRALHIYGPDVSHLKGKTTRRRPEPIPITDLVPIPEDVLAAQKYVNLSMVYFFVQGIPVLHTISRNFHFQTVEFLLNKNKASESDTRDGVKRVLPVYQGRGLRVTKVNCDNEFEGLQDMISPATLHVVGANEHVGDIERSIRTIKECTQCHVHRLPYTRYPKL